MRPNDFGIYIQTYPGDVHLSSVLVLSIQQVSPEIPIMIIPGDDFDYENHPFDVPIMPTPDGFWAELGHKDRSFWAFQGPFETFLFLDADMICVKSLDPIAERVARQRGDFLLVQPWMEPTEWRAVMGDPTHPQHEDFRALVRSEVGRGPFRDFDPDQDFFPHYPFNTGAFASRRGVVRESDLTALHQAERKFYRETLRKEWSWEARDLFFYDQGRMNYLAGKLSIPLAPFGADLICRAGAGPFQIAFEQVADNSCDFHLIHWMGAKSPSSSFFSSRPLFNLYAALWAAVGKRTGRYVHPRYRSLPECVGYSLWQHYREERFGPMPIALRLRWSWRDLARMVRLFQRWVTLAWLRRPT